MRWWDGFDSAPMALVGVDGLNSMNEWINERINEWMNERMNEWIFEWMNEWRNEWIKKTFANR